MKIYLSSLHKRTSFLHLLIALASSLLSPPTTYPTIKQRSLGPVNILVIIRCYLTDMDIGVNIHPIISLISQNNALLMRDIAVLIKNATNGLTYITGDLQTDISTNLHNISLINKEAALLHQVINQHSYNLRKGQQIFAQYV